MKTNNENEITWGEISADSSQYYIFVIVWQDKREKTGVFRRYHVHNDPINWIDPEGATRKRPGPYGYREPILEGGWRGLPAKPGRSFRSPGKTIDSRTGCEVQRFVVDPHGNTMIEPRGGRTVKWTPQMRQ